MRTAIVSDLHLGTGIGGDLLRTESVREALAPELARADRVVLLGDVIELRDRPLGAALDSARPVLRWLGETIGERELVLVPGNHDHHLVAPWIERRGFESGAELELEQLVEPLEGPLRSLADAARPARLTVSYPGIRVRSDVYATHGHYLDRHLTIPTLERLGVALVERLLGVKPLAPGPGEDARGGRPGRRRARRPGAGAGEAGTSAPEGSTGSRAPGPATPVRPLDYERAQTPVYEFLFALAQAAPAESPGGAGPSIRAWELLTGGETRAARMRGWLLGSVALPGAVGVANRLGLGPVRSDLSPRGITAAGLAAMRAVVERLAIGAEHVVFGHTHRRGPLPGEQAWAAGPTRLWNTGSWVFSPSLAGSTGPESPYWPGTVVVVGDAGPPEPLHLLDGWSRAELERLAAA